MDDLYTVTGTLTDSSTVALDEALPLANVRVRMVVQPLPTRLKPPYEDVMRRIRQHQQARGHKPPTKEEIDAYLRAERESWEE